jgi:hypothetical protein
MDSAQSKRSGPRPDGPNRIIYQVFPKTSTIIVRLAASRENLYRRLKEMRIKPLKLKQP